MERNSESAGQQEPGSSEAINSVTAATEKEKALNLKSGGKYLIISINHSHAGFFAYVNFALNQLLYAERHGLKPVVFFGRQSGDGPNAFFDPLHGENIWDYYFEPVAQLTYDDIQERLANPDDRLGDEDVIALSSEQLWQIHCDEPASIFAYPHSMYFAEAVDAEWYLTQRCRANRVIESYIRVKPHIRSKVDRFVNDHFGDSKVLGVHMRGTDKGTAHVAPELMRVVRPKEYFPYIDSYIHEIATSKIFVATDQRQFLNQMVKRYGDRVVSYDALRTTGIRNLFELNDGQCYRKGEDVLVDCLLLSRCDFLLKCTSAVGEFAMYFNPGLECIDLNHETCSASRLTLFRVRLKRWLYLYYLKLKSRLRHSN